MLLALKQHYSTLMSNEYEKANSWGEDDSYTRACREKYAEYQERHREVSTELESYHHKIVENKI